MVCFLCFDSKPPSEGVKAGGASGAKYNAILRLQNNPNVFAVSLLDSPMKEPLVCCVSCITGVCGLPACYYRKKTLETLGHGVDGYVCCQGYFPGACGIEPASMCQGSMAGLLCEGLCCPSLSLSITRIFLMDARQLQPDPVDYQIIAFSNACQVLSCVCDILACFFEDLREFAQLIDCIADMVTFSVVGCMGAQIESELKAMNPLAVQMQR